VNARLSWIVGEDTGISSRTIWAVMMGVRPERANVPIDPADFGRCYRLLKVAPEWRERLGEVAEAYPIWGPMVAAWDELEVMYEAAVATGKNVSPESRRMYDRMRELRASGAGKEDP
jgi:hypothetical protein